MKKIFVLALISMFVLGGIAQARKVVRPTKSDQPVSVVVPSPVSIQVINTTPRDYNIKVYSSQTAKVFDQDIAENSTFARNVEYGKSYLVKLCDESGNVNFSQKFLGRLDDGATVRIPHDFPGLDADVKVAWTHNGISVPAYIWFKEVDDQGAFISGTMVKDWYPSSPVNFNAKKGGNYTAHVVKMNSDPGGGIMGQVILATVGMNAPSGSKTVSNIPSDIVWINMVLTTPDSDINLQIDAGERQGSDYFKNR